MVVRLISPKSKFLPSKLNYDKLYIKLDVLNISESNGKGFVAQFHCIQKLCQIQLISIQIQLNLFQRVSSPYDQTTSLIDMKLENLQ